MKLSGRCWINAKSHPKIVWSLRILRSRQHRLLGEHLQVEELVMISCYATATSFTRLAWRTDMWIPPLSSPSWAGEFCVSSVRVKLCVENQLSNVHIGREANRRWLFDLDRWMRDGRFFSRGWNKALRTISTMTETRSIDLIVSILGIYAIKEALRNERGGAKAPQ